MSSLFRPKRLSSRYTSYKLFWDKRTKWTWNNTEHYKVKGYMVKGKPFKVYLLGTPYTAVLESQIAVTFPSGNSFRI